MTSFRLPTMGGPDDARRVSPLTKPVRPLAKIDGPALIGACKMKLDFIDRGKLSISKDNMRYAKKAPDESDILPTVRARDVPVPLIAIGRESCRGSECQ